MILDNYFYSIAFLIFVENKIIMLSLSPKDITTAQLQGYLQGAVSPRPIAFASTIDADGNPNLSPFSFLMFLVPIRPFLFFPQQEECVIIPQNTL
ncbi:hypothetical protein FPS14_contig00074-0005 [Flavobacterium psychrophilum]|nr:hypothetical protein FPS14_contig00074-0005 [Flavobacterium psychrophilum]